MYCIILYCIILYCIILYYIVLYCMEDRRQLDGGGENEEFVRDEELVGGVVELTLVLLLYLSIVVYFSLYVFNFRITESYVVIF